MRIAECGAKCSTDRRAKRMTGKTSAQPAASESGACGPTGDALFSFVRRPPAFGTWRQNAVPSSRRAAFLGWCPRGPWCSGVHTAALRRFVSCSRSAGHCLTCPGPHPVRLPNTNETAWFGSCSAFAYTGLGAQGKRRRRRCTRWTRSNLVLSLPLVTKPQRRLNPSLLFRLFPPFIRPSVANPRLFT